MAKDPVIRFKDIVPIWEAARANGGVQITAASDSEAVNMVYRLNQYRRILREQNKDEYTWHDEYVVQRKGNVVTIKDRPQIPLDNLCTLDGKPIEIETELKPSPLDHIRPTGVLSPSDLKTLHELRAMGVNVEIPAGKPTKLIDDD